MDIHLRPEDIAAMPEEVQALLKPEPLKPLESNLPAWLQGVPLEHRAHLVDSVIANAKRTQESLERGAGGKVASVPVRPVRTPDPVPTPAPAPSDKWWQQEELKDKAPPSKPLPPVAPRIVETHRVEIRTQVPPYLIVMLGFSLLATLLLALALILLALK